MIRFTIALSAALALAMLAPIAASQDQRAGRATKAAPAAASRVVNLNTATAAEIDTLPGIGPKTAELIIQYRQKNSGFKKIEEIMNIRGVGEKTFLKIKDRISAAPAK